MQRDVSYSIIYPSHKGPRTCYLVLPRLALITHRPCFSSSSFTLFHQSVRVLAGLSHPHLSLHLAVHDQSQRYKQTGTEVKQQHIILPHPGTSRLTRTDDENYKSPGQLLHSSFHAYITSFDVLCLSYSIRVALESVPLSRHQ